MYQIGFESLQKVKNCGIISSSGYYILYGYFILDLDGSDTNKDIIITNTV